MKVITGMGLLIFICILNYVIRILGFFCGLLDQFVERHLVRTGGHKNNSNVCPDGFRPPIMIYVSGTVINDTCR